MKKFKGKLKAKFRSSRSATPVSQPPTRVDSPAPAVGTATTEAPEVPSAAISTPASQSQPSLLIAPSPKNVVSSQSQELSKTLETSWNSFKFALRALKEVSSVFPPLQAAVGGLLKVIDVADQVSTNRENLESMNRQMGRLCQALQSYSGPGSRIPEYVQATVDALSQSIERRKKFIEERMERSLVGRVLNASDDANEIINSLRELSFAVDLFQIGTLINVESQGREINEIVKDIRKYKLFEILSAVPGARFDESSHNGCMDGTCIDTLTKLFAWASDPGDCPIFWLSGMAGIGKSTIAHSFCQKMIGNNQLGASFFCSRHSESLNDVSRILPTIAYQLAFRSPVYRDALIEVLRRTSHTSYGSIALQKQAQDLFIDLKDHLKMNNLLVVVIDALDECSRPSDVSDLLRVVLRSELPIKILITSRPVTHIGQGFSTLERFDIDTTLTRSGSFLSKLLQHASLRLHDAEHDVVEEDIIRYLTSKLSSILKRIDRENAPKILRSLAKRSGKLFIFAFTAVQYILGARRLTMDARHRISVILGSSGAPPTILSMQTIDDLYQQIFKSAYEKKELSEIEDLRASLDTLLCLRRPESVSVISTLLNSHRDDVRARLEEFSSVLSIPISNEEPVFIFHVSFADYVLDVRRSGSYGLVNCDQHLRLARACLELMNRMLHENICGIKRRQTLNADISESVVQSQIPAALRYSCIYWASHLEAGSSANKTDVSLSLSLKGFVDVHLLHWLECLSLIQALDVAYNCIQKARLFVTRHVPEIADFEEAKDILLDAQYMVPQIYYFVKLHALEVYASALMWLPEHHWNPSLQVLHPNYEVYSVAFSPDGVHMACASDYEIQIWSLETAFSPDGSKLASGSYDRTVQIWNASTGELIQKLTGHADEVTSVAFSPDGSKLASGSYDTTVQIWDAETGELIQKLTGHTDEVTSLAFSPDGSKLASGSYDKTVQFWNVDTAEIIQKLLGHINRVCSVAFSPDGIKFASGSDDKTVQIWNAKNGELILKLIGHMGAVLSVAFSSNGSRLASGSNDQTLQIWNTDTGELVQRLTGHSDVVWSVAFSPDGSKLASGSIDRTMQIWNTDTRELGDKLTDHTGAVLSIAFSPDGSKLASGSIDKTIQIWSANTGEFIDKLSGHTGAVLSVAFSPDGSMLASGSDDKTVQIWNAENRVLTYKLIGHTGAVLSVAFSSDSTKIASGSYDDSTVQIWSARTGELIYKLAGHTAWVTSVTFSPDGSQLAFGSYDDAVVQIRDVDSGQLVHKFTNHTAPVLSTAFSPDGLQLASELEDKSVQVWNVETGKLIQRLTHQTHPSFSLPASALQSHSHNQKIASGLQGLQSSSVFYFWTIYQPTNGQYSITIQHAVLGTQPLLWMWGSNIQPDKIIKVTSVGQKICLGYETGKIVIVELSVE